MKEKILVSYASKYGSTQEVAEAVAAELRESGFTADIQPMQKVKSLAGYGVVVLGAPLYLGRWHRDALHFLAHYREALTPGNPGSIRVAIFALGPTHTDEDEWQASRAMLDKELAGFPWLTPVAIEMFGGKYDPAKLRFPDRLIAGLPASPLHGMPPSDVRDWTAIRLWANSLVPKFQFSLSQ